MTPPREKATVSDFHAGDWIEVSAASAPEAVWTRCRIAFILGESREFKRKGSILIFARLDGVGPEFTLANDTPARACDPPADWSRPTDWGAVSTSGREADVDDVDPLMKGR